MKMKTLIQFLIPFVATALIVNSCSKTYYECEPTNEEDPRWPWNITAEWEQESVNFDFKITSNSDQLAVDFTTPSEDSLVAQFSDGTSASLKYLQASLGDTNIILAQNHSIGSDSYPLHELIIVDYSDVDPDTAVYSISTDDSGDSEDYSGLVQFSFDPSGYALSLSEQTLFNSDSSQSVNLNGAIDINTTQLVANNPISVPLSFTQTTTTIILNPSGEYFRLTNDGSGVPDEADGTWEVTDTTAKTMTIIETYEDWESGETVTETLSISYTFESDILTFSQSKDPCEGYADEAECFDQFELNFGLSEGSITELSLTSTMTFNKATTGKERKITGFQPAYWFGKTNYFKELYLK